MSWPLDVCKISSCSSLLTVSPPPLAWGVPRIQRLPLAATSGRRLILILSPFAGLTYQIKNGPKIFFKWNAFWFFFFSPWYPMYHLKKVGNLFLVLVLFIYFYLFIYVMLFFLFYLFIFFFYCQCSTLVNALGVRHSQNQCPSTLSQVGTSIENGMFSACSPIGTLPIVAKEYGNVFFFVERTFHPILYFGCSLKVIWIGGVLTNKGPT